MTRGGQDGHYRDMDEEKRYSDREVEALIARAVELSREEALPEKPRGGMSLAEVEKAAAEAGLSPDIVRRAALELAARKEAGGSRMRRFLRAEKETAVRRLAVQPSREAIDRLLLVLPDLADAPGQSVTAPGGFVFRTDGGYEARMGSRLRLELSKDGEGSALRVERSFDGAAGGIYGGLMGGLGLGCGLGVGLGVGLGAMHSPAFALAFGLGSLVLSYLASRGLMSLIQRDAKHRNGKLLEETASRLESGDGD